MPFGAPFGPQDPPSGQPTDPLYGAAWAPPPGPEGRWRTLEQAASTDDPAALARLAARMVHDDPVTGLRVAERLLTSRLSLLWRGGWQPVELVRQVRRRATKAAAQLIEIAIHVEHARHVGRPLDPRWATQLGELGGQRMSTSEGWVARWRDQSGYDEDWAVVQIARAMAVVAEVPRLDVLIPPPGARPGTRVTGVPLDTGVDDPVLRRVRKLLAKAESTMFEHEADSLTAKAHELMTKYAIDQALLHVAEPSDTPRTVRVPIDAPYADAKSLLLQTVASAHRCRTVFLTGLDLSTVVGHAGDLRAVELIFTSLLVQAQHALATAGDGAGTRARSQSYRSAFYVAFATRIGERLCAVTADVLAEVGDGAHLPVLRAREEAVDAAFHERHGDVLRSTSVRGGWDSLGHSHGRRAADAARFGVEEIAG